MRYGSLALLVLSMVALLFGPIVSYGLRRRHWFWSALDGFVLFAVGGFVFLHVLPDAVRAIHWIAIPIAVVGFLSPLVLVKARHITQQKAQAIALLLTLVGLMVHAAIDGMTLALPTSNQTGFSALALAVVVHRLPMGLAVWLLVRSLFGTRTAIITLLGVGLSTVVGFVMTGNQNLLSGPWIGIFQAFLGGTLVHVLLHHPQDPEDTLPAQKEIWKWPEFAGACVGLALVLLFPDSHHHEIAHTHPGGTFAANFLHIALTSAPALLLGYLLAGLLPTVIPNASMGWLRKGTSLGQVSRGVLFGLPLPICSCGVVPLYQSLIRRGVPATAAMAFLVATPELGIESLLLSLPLLGGPLTGIRLASAFLVAMAVGWFVGRMLPPPAIQTPEHNPNPTQPMPWRSRFKSTVRVGFVEILDDTAPWILAGLIIAALLQPDSMRSWLTLLPPGTDVVFFAVVGIPIYVCASGATPLAAALIFAGVSPGAAIAFLLAGPATNITTFGVLTKLHNRNIAILFGLSVIVVSVALGYLTNIILGAKFSIPLAAVHQHTTQHAAHHHSHGILSLIQWLCLMILGAAFVLSMLRQGIHSFLLSVFSLGTSQEDEHEHDSHHHTNTHEHTHEHNHNEHGHGHTHEHSHKHGHEHTHEHEHEHEQNKSQQPNCQSSCGCHHP